MRVLQVNKFGTATSGAEKYFLELAKRQANAGHDVAVMCMRPLDVPSNVKCYELEDIEFHGLSSIPDRLRAARNVWWSEAAARAMRRCLSEFKPDVVHFHNYAHQLSSSVVEIVNSTAIPTINTAHDYKLICPAYIAFRDGSPCFRCSTGKTTPCVTGRCLHGAVAWSALAAAEAHSLRKKAEQRLPRTIIAPSQFMADRLHESWLADAPKTRVEILRNPADTPEARETRRPGPAGVYVGRLSPEKGVDLLIAASAEGQLPLKVIGDGPDRHRLERLAAQLGAPVVFTGHLAGPALEDAWSTARYLALTPRWPENAPLVMLEALARGVPIAVADLGGAPEIVRLYGGGVVIPTTDPTTIAEALDGIMRYGTTLVDLDRLASDLGWKPHLYRLQSLYENRLASEPPF